MSLLEERLVYKPFKYPWAYEAWLKQQRIHWLPEEVPLAEDVKDWEKNLTAPEKKFSVTTGDIVLIEDGVHHKVFNTSKEELYFVCVFDGKRSH